MTLPTIRPFEKEGDYNQRVATESTSFGCLDAKCVSIGGGSNKIEICDLLRASGQFIHVKKLKGSATFSHLLNQAKVSATLLLEDSDFRAAAKQSLKTHTPRVSTYFQKKSQIQLSTK